MNTRRALLWSGLLAGFLLPLTFLSTAAQPPAPDPSADAPEESIDRLASELPRVPPRAPAESLETLQLQPGFHAELVAAEPLVRDPVAIAFDENGRAYVAELPQYNSYAVEDFEGQGSIRLLEDADGDGRYEKSTLFAEGLEYPTAVACWDGGLFVGAAPDLLYLKDTDGDGRADERRVVFTGFGTDKAGEAHLNSFRWGMDNRFHFSTSLSGGEIRAADAPDTEAVSVRGRGFVFDPRDWSRFEVTSGGGQHGMSMDDWGRKFVCSNSVPAQMLMYDDRYLARNPHARAPAAAVDIAPEGKFTRLYRISPDEPWRKLRTKLRKEGKFRGSDEGGTPFGFFTGATGVTIYRGDAWPEEYQGNLLVGDVANNLVYRATLETDGLRPIARRADKDAEFVASKDIWFRPVQMANAPDGTLWVLDIYRELIEGAAFLPPEFLKYLDPVGGNDRGRIYRIAPDGFERPEPPRLGEATTEQLVKLLDHRNGWHRDTASRLLYERQDRAAIRPLLEQVRSASLAVGRACSLHALAGLNALDEESVLAGLSDDSPLVRVHALRLAERLARAAPAVVSRMAAMTEDPDLRVRYQLAFSLGAHSTPATRAALARLLLRDGENPWMRMAVSSSLAEGAGAVFGALAGEEEFRTATHGQQFLTELAQQIGTANRQDEVAVVIATLQRLPEDEKSFAQQLVQALVTNQQGESREKMLSAASGEAGALLDELLARARATATDEQAEVKSRVEAIRSLRLAPFAQARELFEELLDLRQPAAVQSAVLESLGAYSNDDVPALILGNWQGYSPSVRSEAIETLLSREDWVMAFLDAVEAGDVSRADLDPARVSLLRKHPTESIATRASGLFEGNRLSKRKEVVERYRAALALAGDAARGKQVFKKTCSACHQLEGVGTAVGAELKGIRNRGLEAVMLNILDPNREVKPLFLTYVVLTLDGKSITGMIRSESANSLTLRRPDGTEVEVPRADIDQLRSTGLSFMPEGLEAQIDPQAMADLLAYLDSIQ